EKNAMAEFPLWMRMDGRHDPWQEEEQVMSDLPSIELLASTHTFPCAYMFKVIGLSERGFAARTVAAVREEMAADVDPPFRVRETTGGRHIAVTLQPTLDTPQQVLALYRRPRHLAGPRLLRPACPARRGPRSSGKRGSVERIGSVTERSWNRHLRPHPWPENGGCCMLWPAWRWRA